MLVLANTWSQGQEVKSMFVIDHIRRKQIIIPGSPISSMIGSFGMSPRLHCTPGLKLIHAIWVSREFPFRTEQIEQNTPHSPSLQRVMPSSALTKSRKQTDSDTNAERSSVDRSIVPLARADGSYKRDSSHREPETFRPRRSIKLFS